MITEKKLRQSIKNARRLVTKVSKVNGNWQFLALSNSFLGEPITYFISVESYGAAVKIRTMNIVQKALRILGFRAQENSMALNRSYKIKPYTVTNVTRRIIRDYFKS